MKDADKLFRHAIFNVLAAGNLKYSLIDIPVYDEKKKESDINSNLFVLLGAQRQGNEGTMDDFITRNSIEIEVVQKTGSEVSKDIIDDVSNDILEILMPDPYTNGITDPAGFQVTNLRFDGSVTGRVQVTQTQSVLIKVITVSAIIVQN